MSLSAKAHKQVAATAQEKKQKLIDNYLKKHGSGSMRSRTKSGSGEDASVETYEKTYEETFNESTMTTPM